jgi:MoaA/NifB/PqqE/SkfB family radical SAM enzyme
MIRVAIKHRAARIGLLGLAQVGRLASTKRNMVTPAEYAVLSLILPRLAHKYKGKIEVSEMLVSRGLPVESVGTFTCSIDSDGSIYPANLVLGDSRFRIGSLRESPLRYLWFSPTWIRFRRGPKKFRTLGLEQASREP